MAKARMLDKDSFFFQHTTIKQKQRAHNLKSIMSISDGSVDRAYEDYLAEEWELHCHRLEDPEYLKGYEEACRADRNKHFVPKGADQGSNVPASVSVADNMDNARDAYLAEQWETHAANMDNPAYMAYYAAQCEPKEAKRNPKITLLNKSSTADPQKVARLPVIPKKRVQFYAVAKGRKYGIFMSWEDCRKQVHGFKGARYKKFKTRTEALMFLRKFKHEPTTTAGVKHELRG